MGGRARFTSHHTLPLCPETDLECTLRMSAQKDALTYLSDIRGIAKIQKY